ncbi:ArfGap-domain-containing protein [Tilletiaria anomala UBC 951]|uniref:ArfGap-domain-containing protein n=1 Tax=Tilletiaria anomala (strain ATCC 24038 / CBS 436.72 / UBC 951) TaxID=1037660 RepID=A0A066VIX2_TILAU|nr:ArfGap-domain-containing protein [Tilletiaria anomala UBC 951]KDN41421.1 ArfGap-domain-containing protein [Tilletiaria anomala UBC 951]
MSRVSQSKAQTEANAKILRALVKQPDNKMCADCKRNDPRWASWNLGCFLCIRCSGIHRSMGTHISKVKSIDLDIWTPEQMASIQAWGNKRANTYWEAHLKAGHAPPEHKVEAFIRSKYDSRRWAKEGPLPNDPSVLDGPGATPSAPVPTASSSTSRSAAAAPPPKVSAIDLLGGDPSPAPASTSTSKVASNAQLNNFLDDGPPPASKVRSLANVSPTPPSALHSSAPRKASGGGGGLFDLDWNDPIPAATSPTSPGTGVASTTANIKADILSLFSAPRAAQSTAAVSPSTARNNINGTFGGLTPSFGRLDLGSSTTAPPPPAGADPWAAVPAGQQSNGSHDSIWGDMTSGMAAPAKAGTGGTAPQKDAFADIWGDFK